MRTSKDSMLSITQKALKAFGYAPAILVPRIVALSVVVVFARQLEPQQLGLYALIITYGEFLDSVLLGWARLGILRFYPRYSGKSRDGLMRDGLLLLFAGIVLSTGIGFAISATTEATSTGSFYLLLMLYLGANGSLRFCLNILRAQGRQVIYVIVEVIRPILGFVFAWVMVRSLGPDYTWVAIGLFGVTGVFALVMLITMARRIIHGEHDRETFLEMMRYSAPLLLVFLWSQLIMFSDRYLLNMLSGPSAVGIYAASYALSSPVLMVLFNAVNLGAFPRLVSAFEQGGNEQAQEVLRVTIGKLMFLCAPTLAAILLLAEPFSVVLLDDAYRENAPTVMRLLALGAFFCGLKSFVFDQIFHLERKSLLQSYTLIPAVILNIGLNLVLIPTQGVVGAAWATVAGYGVAVILSAYYSQRNLKIIWPIRDLAWIGAATFIMGFVILIVRHDDALKWLLVSIPSASITYLLIGWWGGTLRLDNYLAAEQATKSE